MDKDLLRLTTLLTLPQAVHYEVRTGWLPRWLPQRWLIAYYSRRYRRYLLTLPPGDRLFLLTLNQKLTPPTSCAKSPDP